MTKFSVLCPKNLTYKKNFNDPLIKGISSDSRKVSKNFIFVAINGMNNNGEDFISDAIKKGACVIITLKGYKNKHEKSECIFLTSENVRNTYAELANNYYKKKPKLIVGVTGTNGKTSTAWFTRNLWALSGIRSASIGTLGTNNGSSVTRTDLTTPDPVILSKTLRNLALRKVTNTIIEASSHGLSQCRLDGIKFSISAITSLSRDHLDYHKTYSNYIDNKLKLFTENTIEGGTAIINSEIKEYNLFVEAAKIKKLKIISVGSDNNADWRYKIQNSKNILREIELIYKKQKSLLKTNVVGDFQISNLIISMAIVIESGLSLGQVEKTFAKLSSPPGRLERIGKMPIFVDYAHTPDALKNSLLTLRKYTNNKLFVVFGCGGNRDKGKRKLMGKIASSYADEVIVTDDNPRSENSSDIRFEIVKGCRNAVEIADRKEAIYFAIGNLTKGDVLLIAGKGHETTQVYKDQIKHFSDKEVVKEITKLGN